MKNILFVIILLLLFSGCMIANTPTSRVEEYLGKYQRLDDRIVIDYVSLFNNNDINDKYKNDYVELIEKQYSNLSYEVKDEVIDGDSAVVTVQVKVFDYREILDKYDISSYDKIDEYHKMVIDGIRKQKDRVVYTIDFELNKNSNDNWEVLELSYDDRKKLLGIN